jgi:KamA family protein
MRFVYLETKKQLKRTDKMKYTAINATNFKEILQKKNIHKDVIEEIEIVSLVIPFKTNNFVVHELIDWDNYEYCPIYKLTFPNKNMLSNNEYENIRTFFRANDKFSLDKIINGVHNRFRSNINNSNIRENIQGISGIQHRYDQTVLFFPDEGQDCFAYCMFCFRFDQFLPSYKNLNNVTKIDLLIDYLNENKLITDILFTGGDPLIMSAKKLSYYLNRIINAHIHNITTIRIGTRALTYWPHRFIDDSDTADLLDILKRVIDTGYSVKLMVHINHYYELCNSKVIKAIRNLQKIGVVIYAQSPILKGINDTPSVLTRMWKKQVQLGIVPYYMYVLRDTTGTRESFYVSLSNGLKVFKEAYSKVSGLAKTVRGPVLSCNFGKIRISGTLSLDKVKYFVLEFVQCTCSEMVGVNLLVKYNEHDTWIDEENIKIISQTALIENSN